MGPEVFSAKIAGYNEQNAIVKFVAVREPGRGSVSTFLRFQYDLPTIMSGNLTNWVYSEHNTLLCADLLYSVNDDAMRKNT